MDFIVTFSIIVIVATIMNYIFTKLKQPSILAFILTGVLIGPLVFKWVANTAEIVTLSEIGIAFLLFSVGISTDLKQLKKLNLSIFLLPFINIILSFLLLFSLHFLLAINFTQILYLSFIFSFSSTMLVAKLLIDNFDLNSLTGKLSIGILLVEDFIAILAIPILKNISNFSLSLMSIVIVKTLFLILIAFILNRYIYPLLLKHTYKSEQSFFMLSVGSSFLFILISLLLKFDIAVGAFIGGLAISIFPYNLEISNKILSLRNILSMIFFVSLGLQLSFNFAGGNTLILLLIFLIFIYVIKPIIHFTVLLFSGYGKRVSSKTAIILTQVSEFSLILAMQANMLGQISSNIYSAIIIVTSISMLSTPYFYKYNSNIYDFLKPLYKNIKTKYFYRKVNYLKHIPKKINDHIIIVGSDVVGDAVRKVLGRDKNIPLVVVDHDPEKILKLIKKKQNAVCGDINNDEIIHSINLEEARGIVLTLPNFEASIRFLKKAKIINPKLIVYVRAKNKFEALKLYEENADLVIIPKFLESNFILERINALVQDGSDKFSFYKSTYINYLKNDLKD